MTETQSEFMVSENHKIKPQKCKMKKIHTKRSINKVRDRIDSGHNNQEPFEDNYDDSTVEKNVPWFSIILSFFSIFSFLFDFGSDIYLMITYFNQGQLIHFILTLIFVFLPAVIMTSFSLIWYCNDKTLHFTVVGMIFRVILHILFLAPIVRYIDTLIYAWKSKRAKTKEEKLKFYNLMIYEEADSALLRVLESSMESVPQLLLQLYILFTQSQKKGNNVVTIQIISSIFSLISLSWCLTTYQSSLRLTTAGKKEMKLNSMIMMVFWKFLVILPRFLSIALFTSVYNLYILIILGIHYFLMSIYIISQKTTFFSEKSFSFREIMFNFVMAAIYCVDFLNLIESKTRYKYVFYYGISFIEIMIMILLWYFNPPYNVSPFNTACNISNTSFNETKMSIEFFYQCWSDSIRKFVMLETIASFILGLTIMIVYYLRFHPNQKIAVFSQKKKFKSRNVGTAGDNLVHNVDSNLTSTNSENISQES